MSFIKITGNNKQIQIQEANLKTTEQAEGQVLYKLDITEQDKDQELEAKWGSNSELANINQRLRISSEQMQWECMYSVCVWDQKSSETL